MAKTVGPEVCSDVEHHGEGKGCVNLRKNGRKGVEELLKRGG